MTHYELQYQQQPKFNNAVNMVHFHSIYRVVKMADEAVIEIVDTFDSPNGAWNFNQAMMLMDGLQGKGCNVN
jgi:hypothetical protein